MPSFTTSDGLALNYQEWNSEGEGTPVILQHGFVVDTRLNWEAPGVVDALLKAGRRVVALDARGHGQSEKPHDPVLYGEPRMATDLCELIDHLGVPTVDLVGYSMGAVIVLIASATDTRIRKVVAGGLGASLVEIGGVDTRVLDNLALRDALMADDLSNLAGPALEFRQLADFLGGDRIALHAQASVMHKDGVGFSAITIPTLIIAGTADPLAGRPEVLAAMFADGSLAVVDGDHQTAVGNPEFSERVTEFLALQ